MFKCTLRICTDENPNEWKDRQVTFLHGSPNPGEVMTIDDDREIEIISSGVIDFKAFTWARELAPTAA